MITFATLWVLSLFWDEFVFQGWTWWSLECVLDLVGSFVRQWKVLCVDAQASLLLECLRLLDHHNEELLRIAWVVLPIGCSTSGQCSLYPVLPNYVEWLSDGLLLVLLKNPCNNFVATKDGSGRELWNVCAMAALPRLLIKVRSRGPLRLKKSHSLLHLF